MHWDGEGVPQAVAADGTVTPGGTPAPDADWELAGSLAAFCAALRGGPVPDGEVHANVWTQAIVEAAVRSADEDRTVTLAEVLDEALAAARTREDPPEVLAALTRWENGTAGLTAR